MVIYVLNRFKISMERMVSRRRATNGLWHRKCQSDHIFPLLIDRNMGNCSVSSYVFFFCFSSKIISINQWFYFTHFQFWNYIDNKLQGGCAWFAYQRFQQGVDVAFASTYESDPTANQYSAYPIGNETDQYNEPPFSNAGQQQQRGKNNNDNPLDINFIYVQMQHNINNKMNSLEILSINWYTSIF